MASRRSLATTAAIAGALLAAVFFVPTASAAYVTASTTTSTTSTTSNAAPAASQPGTPTHRLAATGRDLADTGSVDTAPYVVGGTAFLAMGAALLVAARRRTLVLGQFG